MKPRLLTLIPAFALLMSSTSLTLAQSSTPSEQESGQPAETTETSPESGSGVNAEEGAESEKEDEAGNEEGAETGEASEDDTGNSVEEEADESTEGTDNTAEDATESEDDTTGEAADSAGEPQEGTEEATEEETTEGDSAEETPVDISSLRPLKGEYEGVTLSNGMAAEEVVGSSVVNSEGEDLGRVEDLLADDSGEAVAVLMESGGILGFGAKQTGIPLSELSAGEDGELVSSLTEEDIESMPEYEAPEDMN